MYAYVKVKCNLVQALRLCTGRTAHTGSRGIALLFHDHGSRRGWGTSVTPRPLFTPRKDPVPIVQDAGWAPGPVWTGGEKLAPTGIRSRDRPARSQSLYRLHYSTHCVHTYCVKSAESVDIRNDIYFSGNWNGKQRVQNTFPNYMYSAVQKTPISFRITVNDSTANCNSPLTVDTVHIPS